MSRNNIEVVDELTNGRRIVKIEKKIIVHNETKRVIKFTIADRNGLVNILDSKGHLSGIQFFDCYFLNEFGDIIIGIKKDGEEYYKRVLVPFYLSNEKLNYDDPFNIGSIENIIPQSYAFNYGLINRNGLLVIYPSFDQIEFGSLNTCRLGFLCETNLKLGYNDLLSGNSITPICFDVAMDFSEGKAIVGYKNSYGYIDRQKHMNDPKNPDEYADNLSPRFVRATDFKDGTAMVISNPSFCVFKRLKINIDGDILEILPPARVVRKRKMYSQGKN